MLSSPILARLPRRKISSHVSVQAFRFLSSTPKGGAGSDYSNSDASQLTSMGRDIINKPNENSLTNEQILKIAKIDLVSKKEMAIMEREKKIVAAKAIVGLAVSLFGLSLGGTVFMSIP